MLGPVSSRTWSPAGPSGRGGGTRRRGWEMTSGGGPTRASARVAHECQSEASHARTPFDLECQLLSAAAAAAAAP